MSKDQPEILELFERISRLLPLAVAFEGVVVRSAGTHYANEDDFLSGAGSAKVGGRWNRKGIIAVYASLDILTAIQEAYQNILSYGFSLDAIRPRVTAGAAVKLNRVMDLTRRSLRQKLGFSLQELIEEDWQALQNAGEEAWTQAIGRGCREAGFEALLVPSARHKGGKNIIIFPDRLDADSSLTLLGSEDLPPHPDKW
jgi:RES domain-containing protein